MSALDGWIDVCRTGTWTDLSGREVLLGEDDLERVAAAYGSADPAPVVVGHPETDAPAWGWVDGLRQVGDRLQAKLRDIAPAFREAVEEGRYAMRSVALNGDTLVHLGFLGGRAPAVDGLAPTRFSGSADRTILLAASDLADSERWAWGAVRRTLRRLRDWVIERDGVEKADALIPEWDIEAIGEHMDASDTPATLAGNAGAAAAREAVRRMSDTVNRMLDTYGDTGGGADSHDTGTIDDDTEEGAMPDEDKEARLAAEREELAAARAALAAERAAHESAVAAAERLAAADEEIEGHVKAGRVLPAEGPRLSALLASLPDDDAGETRLAFAAPGAGEVRETPRAALAGFLGGLPKRVDYTERAPDGDAAAEEARDPHALASRARALMAADATGSMTIAQAVRRAAAENAG